jgi:predicted chitinase
LTGKDNYERNQNEIQEWFNLNYNLVTNPDLVATNQTVLVYSAIAYILQNVNTIADIDVMTIDQFSALVNTGNSNSSISNVNGATDRRNRYNNLIQNDNLFKCDAQ